jgi:glutamate dehydrogenase
MASLSSLYHVLNIVEAATRHKIDMLHVAKIYFTLLDRLNLRWFRDQINEYPITNHWSVLAKAAYKGDLDWLQRELTVGVLLSTDEGSVSGKVKSWLAQHAHSIERWETMMTELKRVESKEFAILFVALRELLDLARASRRITKNIAHVEKE